MFDLLDGLAIYPLSVTCTMYKLSRRYIYYQYRTVASTFLDVTITDSRDALRGVGMYLEPLSGARSVTVTQRDY